MLFKCQVLRKRNTNVTPLAQDQSKKSPLAIRSSPKNRAGGNQQKVRRVAAQVVASADGSKANESFQSLDGYLNQLWLPSNVSSRTAAFV